MEWLSVDVVTDVGVMQFPCTTRSHIAVHINGDVIERPSALD